MICMSFDHVRIRSADIKQQIVFLYAATNVKELFFEEENYAL